MEKLISFGAGFKEGFSSFGHGVTKAVNTALMALVYFVVVGPTSLAAKAAKKSFLDLGAESRQSYWEELNLSKKEKEDYYNQY